MSTQTNEFSISEAIDGFLLAKAAEGRSPKTLRDYRYCLGLLGNHLADTPISLGGTDWQGLARLSGP